MLAFKYQTAGQVLKAIKKDYCGVVIYDGPSKIDGKPIIAIANRITTASNNDKTGAMVQTFIMLRDIAPHTAVKTGQDVSVCGNCPLRPSQGNNTRCYVRTYQAPLSTWKAYHNARYLRPGVDFPESLIPEIFQDKTIRLGTYGDPYAVPVKKWQAMTKLATKWTGYTHQWRKAPKALAKLCMASADTIQDVDKAKTKGFRTFRVKKQNEPMHKSEFICPASKEGGQKTNCASCGLCAGASITANNPVINDHGLLKNRSN